MGQVDIVIINEIYQYCNSLERQWNWGYHFEQDSGAWETAIEFFDDTEHDGVTAMVHAVHPPTSSDWSILSSVLVPDILAFNDRMIIEYEEESKPMKGPKIRKKGHWEESKHDAERDDFYFRAGFRLCKIWESSFKDGSWKRLIFVFLTNCYRNQIKV